MFNNRCVYYILAVTNDFTNGPDRHAQDTLSGSLTVRPLSKKKRKKNVLYAVLVNSKANTNKRIS